MSMPRQPNRGPAAAESNRIALLKAAETIFSERGLEAPLSAIAREAGVGQGSLYRHFPNRVNLALSVFEANVAGLEILAADETTDINMILDYLTDRSIDSVAFVDIISSAGEVDAHLDRIVERILAVLAAKLDITHIEGSLRPDVEPRDLLMAVGMVAGLLPRTPVHERRAVAARAWSILRSGLDSSHHQGDGLISNNEPHNKEEL